MERHCFVLVPLNSGGGNVWPIIFTHIGRHWVTEIIDKVIPALHESWSHASFRIISTRFFIKNLTAFEKSSLCSILNASLFLPSLFINSIISSIFQVFFLRSSEILLNLEVANDLSILFRESMNATKFFSIKERGGLNF